ncbi:hypothetical protein [Chitinophaga deserti]|uniref:hypothetical protein n=1 Tax=Chitinophaga deserti TaxID=2164099 RepID=UPI000D6C0BFE|nr:hypothetical protein [Chitinophaga deserti]
MATALQKFHRVSGIIIASFLLLHFTNHLFALAGPQAHIDAMNILRKIYRFPPVEILLLACVASQIISGVTLIVKKGFRKKPLAVKLQILSGGYLALFLINHVMAVMMARYQWHIDTDFFFAANVAVQYPQKLFFIPYYTLSLISVFTHIACVHYLKRAATSTSTGKPAKENRVRKETTGILVFGAIVTILIMLTFTGVFYKIG